ncbi:MAG: bifunctional lysine ketoglutarate reductase /saccharopine dehydrogenase family protein [Melioribacteraceae bacterium]|nr:MAG: bifunctional lysine ketoglutarate reductase /saccharopine dehydrogenase family protein [Melioribacteraceae bacterium]
MKKILGIRKEIKNKWERRVTLTPTAVSELSKNFGIKTLFQLCEKRIFDDQDYIDAGAEAREILDEAEIILAVKEIPIKHILENKIYLFFSHTIKGQPYNMPLLQILIDKKCTLIDYEPIKDENDRRLVFFGRHAGYAGMVNGLSTLGKRLSALGTPNPFEKIKQAKDYPDLETAKEEIKMLGENLELPDEINPLVIGITGYGNVSIGAQKIIDLLPVTQISPSELVTVKLEKNKIYKVVFKEEDIVERIDGSNFDLEEYYNEPEKYQSKFDQYLPKVNLLVNAIYWEEKYPRLVTKEFIANNYLKNLIAIADLSCDINGSIEMTEKATLSGNPVFIYDPKTNSIEDGFRGNGIALMTVDNLPAEIPVESSEWFSKSLMPLVPKLFEADYSKDFEQLNLSDELKNACVVYKGELTPNFKYLEEYLAN